MMKSIQANSPVVKLVRKALREKVGGFTPDSRIPIMASFTVEAKKFELKGGVYVPHWEKVFDSEKMALDDLLTNNGRDIIHNVSFMTGTQPAAFTYYAITSTNITPAAGDTALSGEITTPTHMVRHQLSQNWGGVTESYTHTAGTNTTVMVASFENNTGSGSITIYAYGNFNAASGVTMGFESAFTSVTLNSASGAYDVLKITITLTLG